MVRMSGAVRYNLRDKKSKTLSWFVFASPFLSKLLGILSFSRLPHSSSRTFAHLPLTGTVDESLDSPHR
jgi:hypothetical protein